MSTGGGGQAGNGCALPDGRTIPAGQDFHYEQNGVPLKCTCPMKQSGVGKIQVKCRHG